MDEHAIPRASTELATDDWPHLYLEGRHVPVIYYYVLGIVVLLSLLGFGALGALKSGAQNLHFMLLGAAFMLLETRAITQFALLFGSTWIVNAIVIGSILSVIWLGNYLLWTGRTAPPKVIYPLLLACLIVLYVVPIDFALHLSTGPRVLAAAVIIGLPVFLASLVFSESFRHVTDTSAAFGSNLVGVVIGGTLEYASMIWGLDFLYLLALGMYVLSWIALTKSRATIPTT